MQPVVKIFFVIILVAIVAQPVFAQPGTLLPNPLGDCGKAFPNFIKCITNGIFTIAIAVSVLMLLVGAFFLMTSGGSPERIKSGKDALLWAVIGLGVVIIAGGLVQVICQALGATNC